MNGVATLVDSTNRKKFQQAFAASSFYEFIREGFDIAITGEACHETLMKIENDQVCR